MDENRSHPRPQGRVQSRPALVLGDADRRLLEHWVKSPTTPQRVAQRSRMLLLAGAGLSIAEIAAECNVSYRTVKLWTDRVQREGLRTLQHDAPGRGRRPVVDAATLLQQLASANLLNPEGRPVSLRRAAAFLGVSASAVWRALKKNRHTTPALH